MKTNISRTEQNRISNLPGQVAQKELENLKEPQKSEESIVDKFKEVPDVGKEMKVDSLDDLQDQNLGI